MSTWNFLRIFLLMSPMITSGKEKGDATLEEKNYATFIEYLRSRSINFNFEYVGEDEARVKGYSCEDLNITEVNNLIKAGQDKIEFKGKEKNVAIIIGKRFSEKTLLGNIFAGLDFDEIPEVDLDIYPRLVSESAPESTVVYEAPDLNATTINRHIAGIYILNNIVEPAKGISFFFMEQFFDIRAVWTYFKKTADFNPKIGLFGLKNSESFVLSDISPEDIRRFARAQIGRYWFGNNPNVLLKKMYLKLNETELEDMGIFLDYFDSFKGYSKETFQRFHFVSNVKLPLFLGTYCLRKEIDKEITNVLSEGSNDMVKKMELIENNSSMTTQEKLRQFQQAFKRIEVVENSLTAAIFGGELANVFRENQLATDAKKIEHLAEYSNVSFFLGSDYKPPVIGIKIIKEYLRSVINHIETKDFFEKGSFICKNEMQLFILKNKFYEIDFEVITRNDHPDDIAKRLLEGSGIGENVRNLFDEYRKTITTGEDIHFFSFLEQLVNYNKSICEKHVSIGHECDAMEVENFLKYMRLEAADLETNHRGRAVIVFGTENSSKEAVANILAGLALNSSTTKDTNIYPEFLADPVNRTYSIYSAPTLSKSKTKAKSLASHFFSQQILQSCNAAKLIITISQSTLDNDREEIGVILNYLWNLVYRNKDFINSVGFVISHVESSEGEPSKAVMDKLLSAFENIADNSNTSDDVKEVINILLAKRNEVKVRLLLESQILADTNSYDKNRDSLVNFAEIELKFLKTSNGNFSRILTAQEKELSDCAVVQIKNRIPNDMAALLKPLEDRYNEVEQERTGDYESLLETFDAAVEEIVHILQNITNSKATRHILSSFTLHMADLLIKPLDDLVADIDNDAVYLKNIGHSSNKAIENGFSNIFKYLLASRRWYYFLVKLNYWVGEHETMKNMEKYQEPAKIILAKIRTNSSTESDVLELINIVDSLPQKAFRNLLGNIKINPSQFSYLESLIDKMFANQIDVKCVDGKTICKGMYILMSVCLAQLCENMKFLEIQASNRFYLDRDLSEDLEEVGRISGLTIISPLWQIIDNRDILLFSYNPDYQESRRKGKPVSSSGPESYFLGIAERIILDGRLEITTLVGDAFEPIGKNLIVTCEENNCSKINETIEDGGKNVFLAMIFLDRTFSELTQADEDYSTNMTSLEKGNSDNNKTVPNFAIDVNKYKAFIRLKLESKSKNLRAKRFLNHLATSKEINALYDTYSFADDYKRLEYQSFHLKEKTSVVDYLDTLLHRIANYTSTVKTTNEEKKVLTFIYTAILGKLASERSNSKFTVVNLPRYLEIILEDFAHLRDLKNDANVDTYQEDYLRNVKTKTDEADNLVKSEVLPMVDSYLKELNKQIDVLVQEVVALKKANRIEKDALLAKRTQLKNSLVWRKFMTILGAVASFMSFLGPMTVSTGMAVYSSALLGEEFVSGDSGGESTSLGGLGLISSGTATSVDAVHAIEKIPAVVSENLNTIHQLVDKKITRLFNQLSQIIKKLSELPSSEAVEEIKVQVNETKEALLTLDKESLEPSTISKVNLLREQLSSFLTEKKSKLEGQGNLDQLIETLSLSQALLTVPEHGEKDTKTDLDIVNDAELEEVGRQIKENEEAFERLEIYEERIFTQMLPMVNDVSRRLNAVGGRSRGQSQAYLDIAEWKVEEYLSDIIRTLGKMTNGFEVSEQFEFVLNKVKRGMATMMNVFHRIADNQDKAQLAVYLGNLNSDKASSIKIQNPKLRKLLNEMEIAIQNNLILDSYERVHQTFLQSFFPYGGELIKGYTLPAELVLGNSTDNLVLFASERVSEMINKIQTEKATISNYRSDNFGNQEFSKEDNKRRPAFYTWTYEKNKRAISDLLDGKTVEMNADINDVYGVNLQRNAIKFKDLRLALIPHNSSLSSKVEEVLSRLFIHLTTLGTFNYKCREKYYQISNNIFTIAYSHRLGRRKKSEEPAYSNDVYKKIKENSPIFSPYGLWNITLSRDIALKDASDLLNEIKDIPVDLRFYGKGFYVKPNGKICDTNLDLFYRRSPQNSIGPL